MSTGLRSKAKEDEIKVKSFWKRSSPNMPGSSRKSTSISNDFSPQHGPRHKLTFKEFENHTEDAWDATDDDLLRTALAKIELGSSPDQVHATAEAVIANHSKLNTNPMNTTNSPSQQTSANKKQQNSSSKRVPGGASRTVMQNSPKSKRNILQANGSQNSHDRNGNIDANLETNGNSDVPEETSENKKGVLHAPSIAGGGSAPKSQTIRMPMQSSNLAKENSKIEKFRRLIDSDSTDLDELKKLSWSGIPAAMRSLTWKLLSGYLPVNKDRRKTALARKQNDYFKFVKQFYDARDQPMYQTTFHQIHIDIPRTNPLIPLFQQEAVQNIFERLLFVWAVRHPASGYVQGINDLVTPFFVVFLSAEIDDDQDVETFDVGSLPEETQRSMEADTFWCVSNLLDGIQDNYTFAQPGVQTKVNKLRELTKRVDAELHAHLEREQIEYLQFSFRWMNNLLMREIPLRCTIRLWDTYLAEPEGFSDFHLYVCAAFLKQWRNQLLGEQDFQGLMLMIQNVPTHHWGDEEVKVLLAEAFRLKYTFADAPSHLPTHR
ncbi:TBC1 domain family member 22B-like [Ciona intestinalis]